MTTLYNYGMFECWRSYSYETTVHLQKLVSDCGESFVPRGTMAKGSKKIKVWEARFYETSKTRPIMDFVETNIDDSDNSVEVFLVIAVPESMRKGWTSVKKFGEKR